MARVMLATFRKPGDMSRWLTPLPTRYCRHCGWEFKLDKGPAPMLLRDLFGRPLLGPHLERAFELFRRISPEEKKKFGFVFAKLLDLPNPPEDPPNGNFVVKLLDFDIQRKSPLLREISAVKTAVKQIKDLSELGMDASMDVIDDGLPSVIKDGLSEEEAKEIVAKIESVGGVVVMEPME